MFAKRVMWVLLAALAMGSAAANQTAVRAAEPDSAWVPAAKRDNGLGALPHYREWRAPWLYAIPAPSIDNGLGDLLPFAEWREPWLHAIPADGRGDNHRQPPPRIAPAAGTTAARAQGG